MRTRGVDALVFMGVATNQRVETSVRDGRNHDFNLIVLSGGCASWTEEDHQLSLEGIFRRLGRVMTGEQFVNSIRK